MNDPKKPKPLPTHKKRVKLNSTLSKAHLLAALAKQKRESDDDKKGKKKND